MRIRKAGIDFLRSSAFILFAFLFPVLVFAQSEAELVNKVKAKLDKVNDYKANGVMNIDVPFIKAPASDVTVFYKKPSRFRIKKEGGISILPKGGMNVNLGSILAMEKYTVVPAGESIVNNVKMKIIKLLPEDENSSVVITTLYIDEAALLIKKSIVTTKESGTYEMEMTYGKYSNWGLPDKVVFSFNTKDYKLPKGVTFEYESGNKRPSQQGQENKKGKVELSYSSYTINKGVDDAMFKD